MNNLINKEVSKTATFHNKEVNNMIATIPLSEKVQTMTAMTTSTYKEKKKDKTKENL